MSDVTIRQRLIRVDGRRAYLLHAGKGPTVVVLASMLVLARSYIPLIRKLARDFRVLVVEAPGSGRGQRLRPAWSFEQHADWTRRLLDGLDLRDITLIGHSNSGPVAMLMAAKDAGQRIRRLVLADSIGADPSATLLRLLCGRLFDTAYEPILSLQGWPHLLLNAAFHARSFLNQVRLSATTDLRPLAAQVRVPTLVAWGGRDHTTPPAGGMLLRSLIPDARLRVFPAGSHDWLIDCPDDFSRILREFVLPGHAVLPRRPRRGGVFR